ncbi:MAG: nickel-type superoxide dismutase maturation protease [Dehalococcoidia bacterium]
MPIPDQQKGGPRQWAAFFVPVALGGLAALWLRRYQRYSVSGRSMMPALEDGDWTVVDTRVYRRRLPRAGEIVVCTDPRELGRELIKRVIRVEAEGLWVEGDNTDESTDSRVFGVVPLRLVAGRVVARYWPRPACLAAMSASTTASVGKASGGGAAGST